MEKEVIEFIRDKIHPDQITTITKTTNVACKVGEIFSYTICIDNNAKGKFSSRSNTWSSALYTILVQMERFDLMESAVDLFNAPKQG